MNLNKNEAKKNSKQPTRKNWVFQLPPKAEQLLHSYSNSSQNQWVPRMGQNFDEFPDFQQNDRGYIKLWETLKSNEIKICFYKEVFSTFNSNRFNCVTKGRFSNETEDIVIIQSSIERWVLLIIALFQASINNANLDMSLAFRILNNQWTARILGAVWLQDSTMVNLSNRRPQ